MQVLYVNGVPSSVFHGSMCLIPPFDLLNILRTGVRIRHTAHQLNLLLDSLVLALLEHLSQDFACGLVRFLRLLIAPKWVRAFIPTMHHALDVPVKQSLPQALWTQPLLESLRLGP